MIHTDLEAHELRAMIDAGGTVFVLDVRQPDEVAEWSFPGAHHIPLDELADRTAELPLDEPIVVVCHAGVRSAVAAEALARAGWKASSLVGGVVAWQETAQDG